ncbi:MAG: RDD domain containing protein [Candidatus Nomurabacteria bacterium GW2011_GWA1_46_11]|uniref:RDD domain containing protein n=1 Tax=Candidatus Nomurabacteria bacterium GW2011_GWA1_46_11 TaxID=1618732 RepID=A0A0G1RLF8_9BACT|nr:MAG: RDD domain containing protein [Microgenomates group bacterium GW2011_GWB1_44_8]KKU21765.1 MAG: RDD domain containing protein [Candidatus Nomurabacteria bacterium GW2011_GWA1_46_11]
MNDLNRAHFFQRLLARLIEIAMRILFLQYLALLIVSADNLMTLLNGGLFFVVTGLLVVPVALAFIDSFMISKFGGSMGKLLCGLAVVNDRGEHISFWRAFFRDYIGYGVSGSLLGMGFFWALKKERRSWHDLIADTNVVVTRNWGVFLGIVSLTVVLIVNAFTTLNLWRSFNQNRPLYESVVSDITVEIKKVIPESNKPSSTPLPEKFEGSFEI